MRKTGIVKKLAIAGFLAVAVAMAYGLFDTLRQRSWVTTQAVSVDVVGGELLFGSQPMLGGPPRVTDSTLKLEYTYLVNGTPYSGRFICREPWEEALYLRRVFYDPKHPSRSTLRRSVHSPFGYGVGILSAVLAFAIFFQPGTKGRVPEAEGRATPSSRATRVGGAEDEEEDQ